MEDMEKFIIDTNFFFNLEIRTGLGKNPKEIITSFTDLTSGLKRAKKAEFFMPQSIVDEFLGFFDEKKPQFVDDFLSVVSIKSPHTTKLSFSAHVFYKLVAEMRHRSYRGLQIGEEEVLTGAKSVMGREEMDKKEFQMAIGKTIKKLRDRYRQATRFSFLDSVADLDLIVLTKELDGFLVSSDEGVLRWGRIFGVKEIPAQLLKARLQALSA